MRIADMSMLVAIGALTVTAGSWAGDPQRLPATTPGAIAGETAAGPTAVADVDPDPDRTTVPTPRISGTDLDATRRGLEALQAISYDWEHQLPNWEIRFHAAVSGAYGYTLSAHRRIDIYVRPDESDALLAHVIAHELGHAVDVTLNSGDDRQRWLDLRGIDDAPWWPDNRAADFATGAGDFAESFAAWQVGIESFRSELGLPPGDEARALLAELSVS